MALNIFSQFILSLILAYTVLGHIVNVNSRTIEGVNVNSHDSDGVDVNSHDSDGANVNSRDSDTFNVNSRDSDTFNVNSRDSDTINVNSQNTDADNDESSNGTDIGINDINSSGANTTSTTPTATTDRVFRLRERSRSRHRRYRLRWIREQILRSLGWTEPPKIPEAVRRNLPWNHSFPAVQEAPEVREDRRCFSASCTLPRNIDRNLWEDENIEGFRVYTNLASAPALGRSRLHTATLNVFLRYTQGYSCHGEEIPVSSTGSRFLVSVYQFLRPLRIQRQRNRVLNRKRLIDARMVTPVVHEWATFDVRQAVFEWLTGGRNNFGFEIIVKDENETTCNAMSMIVPADCNSPPETGCREDNSIPTLGRFPWFEESIGANYPYIEVVTRQRPNHRPRVRPRQRRDISSSVFPSH